MSPRANKAHRRHWTIMFAIFNIAIAITILLYAVIVTNGYHHASKQMDKLYLYDNNMHAHTPCKLVVEGYIDSTFVNGMFPYYTQGAFEFIFNNTNSKGTSAFIIRSQIDIDHGIDHNLRLNIGNEMCDSQNYVLHAKQFGTHSTLISHWYYHDGHDGNGGDLSYWKSIDPRATFSPMYMPNLFSNQFCTNYVNDTLPFIVDYAQYTKLWTQREYMVSITHSVHTFYRNRLTPFYTETIAKKSNYKSFVKLLHKWSPDNTKKGYLNTEQYRSVLLASKFVVCVAGNTPETLRFWEALAMASIPILAVKHKRYLRGKCKRAYNGFLLYPNMTMQQIETNGLIWSNGSDWSLRDLDASKLLKLNETQQFVPAILLRNDHDLESFLDFVASREALDAEKSDFFWNRYQQLMNQWFVRYVEYKMNELKDIILSQLHSNCSIVYHYGVNSGPLHDI
eukprot:210888_1